MTVIDLSKRGERKGHLALGKLVADEEDVGHKALREGRNVKRLCIVAPANKGEWVTNSSHSVEITSWTITKRAAAANTRNSTRDGTRQQQRGQQEGGGSV